MGAFKPDNASGEISRTAIEIKAKRLENSRIYKKIVTLLQSSLYVAYALERYEVLDRVLDEIRNPQIPARDLAPLAKVFLDETRKPADLKGMELNVNVQNNEVNLVSIEGRLSEIASRMVGSDANNIIEALDANSTSSSV
jgi:hypothetical protein